MGWLTAIGVLLASLFLSTPVRAGEPYFGFQYNLMRLQGAGASSLLLSGRTLRLGLEATPSLGLGWRLGKGLGDDKDNGVEGRNRFFTGIHGRYRLTLGAITGYMLAGYSYAESDLAHQRYYEKGFSYGIGLDWAVLEAVSVNADYLRLGESDGVRQDLLGLGITFRFP